MGQLPGSQQSRNELLLLCGGASKSLLERKTKCATHSLQGAAVALGARHAVALQDAVQALGEVVGQVALLQVLGLQHGLRPHCDGLPLPLPQPCAQPSSAQNPCFRTAFPSLVWTQAAESPSTLRSVCAEQALSRTALPK